MLKIKDNKYSAENINDMVNLVDRYFELFNGKYPLYLEINWNTKQELNAKYTNNCSYIKKEQEVILKYRVYDIVINNDLKDYEFKIVYPVEEVSNE